MAQSTDKNPTPKSDERNIVDSAIFSSGDLEDQLTLIWEKNKKLIIYSIAGIFAVFGAYHLSGFMIEQGRLAVQEDYTSADDSASKLAFAQKESGHPLSGFAYKELAAEAYEEGDYAKAAEYFENASISAKGVIKEAAQMGHAMALIQTGQSDQAESIFKELVSNENAGNLAEARYRLATLAVENEDFEYARTLIADLQTNFSQETFYWIQKAMTLQSKLPTEEPSPTPES
jgi:thioredoxin-like negative regulator of GroEL